MAWTDIDRYHVHQLLDADALNTLRDNLEYLLTPNIEIYQHPGTGSDYTVVGVLGQDLDSTNFALTIESYGGPVVATFYGVVASTTTSDSARVSIVREDDLSYVGRNLYNNFLLEQQRTGIKSISGLVRFDDVPAGTHTFKVVWGVSSGTATMYVAYKPRFCVAAW